MTCAFVAIGIYTTTGFFAGTMAILVFDPACIETRQVFFMTRKVPRRLD